MIQFDRYGKRMNINKDFLPHYSRRGNRLGTQSFCIIEVSIHGHGFFSYDENFNVTYSEVGFQKGQLKAKIATENEIEVK